MCAVLANNDRSQSDFYRARVANFSYCNFSNRTTIFRFFTLIAVLLIAKTAFAELESIQTAGGAKSSESREIVRWTHARLLFSKDIDRIAVGSGEILEVELLSSREVLMLGNEIGQTSLIVWYTDNTTEAFLFSIIQDLSILKKALRDIHPAIRIERAPDRDMVILRGLVPDIKFKIAAEAAASGYLAAGNTGRPNPALTANDDLGADPQLPFSPSATVLNLIQLRNPPPSVEQKIRSAIKDIGGANVHAHRIVKGIVPDDASDTLILKGEVPDQIALVRVLNVATSLYLGAADSNDAIEVLADEAGGLLQNQRQGRNDLASLFNGSGNQGLRNLIASNIGRAKLLSIAGGRILSLISVRDVPQVRVAVRIHEVNRSRLKDWNPDLSLVTGDFRSESFNPPGSGLAVQEDSALRVGATESEVENALQILRGVITNQFQVGYGELAFDLLFSLLEREGISRTLSRPTLTVLSGEPALFQVGGEIPIESSFASAFGSDVDTGSGTGAGNTAGVFGTTEFRSFGVSLSVRALVGENDTITLDINPSVSQPDPLLTQAIADSSGTPPTTTAFNTRSLETSTRIRDGQALVLGGLISRSGSNDNTFTPGLHRLPVAGWLAKSYTRSADDIELVIVVTPTVIRAPVEEVSLWQFVPVEELFKGLQQQPTSMLPVPNNNENKSAALYDNAIKLP